MPRPFAACLLVLTALACQPGEAPERRASTGPTGPDGGELAAEVNGTPITVAELDAFIKEELFRSRAATPAKLHELRDQYLQAMIETRVLAVEAERRGVSSERLLQDEVAALGPVTDDEVAAFYSENRERLGGATLEQVGDRIRDYLTGRRSEEAAQALRERAQVVVHMQPPRFEVAADGHARGPADAPITIVEFSDFQCPYCRRAVPTLDKVLEKYPKDVRLVYRHLPLRSHQRARPAAEASLCAGEQDQFWAYHDKLFDNSRQLEDSHLVGYAEQIGLDKNRFQQCFESGKFASQVDADLEAAQQVGITGTPAFVVNGVLISGAKPPEEFYRVIDAELARLGRAGSSSGG
jgi:protein-disulfide isomerase